MISHLAWASITLVLMNSATGKLPVAVSPYLEGEDFDLLSDTQSGDLFIPHESGLTRFTLNAHPQRGLEFTVTTFPNRVEPPSRPQLQMNGLSRRSLDGESQEIWIGGNVAVRSERLEDLTTGIEYPFEGEITVAHAPTRSAHYRFLAIFRNDKGESHALLFRRNEAQVDRVLLPGIDYAFSATVAQQQLYVVTIKMGSWSILHSINLENGSHSVVSVRPFSNYSGLVCYFEGTFASVSLVLASPDERLVHFLAANRIWTYEVPR
ncbi:MAG: hypothetical protein KF812_05365 [Fimbriimonadaceae bacterium]|nr:hypothetical protein [Fimbriimonadaceae bacterium]